MKSQNQKKSAITHDPISWLEKYLRYTDYIGAAQLYLKDNFFLRRELTPEDIKDRILGHWGTVPGLNFLYAHLNYLISKHENSMMFIAGPGHGAPAVIANLFAENTLAEFYPELKPDEKGTSKLIKMFSWPGGFPSHTNPGTPGAILEGGELGYSLATAFGAVFDNPDLIVACVVGDGEAESGPLAAAWNSNKFLNPAESGAVLPILHANGYKITGPTIYATMSDEELTNLFSGFGYEPRIVNDADPNKPQAHQEMIDTLEWAYQKIRAIQEQFRHQKDQKGLSKSSKYQEHKEPVDKKDWSQHRDLCSTGLVGPDDKQVDVGESSFCQLSARRGASMGGTSCSPHGLPRWPMIIYRSLKGRAGIKYADGQKVEGTYHSHGIPIGDPKTNADHFKLVKNWLESYRFNELVDDKGRPLPEVTEFVPKKNLRMGMNKHAFGGNMRKNLNLPDVKKYEVKVKTTAGSLATKTLSLAKKVELQGSATLSNTAIGSNYIRDIFKLNAKNKNFRFMCPDETESNKFQSLFEATKRAYLWPVHSYDENLSPDGRVMEILSEHTLQGWLQGYLLTGRHGMFATYEAFATIVASMVDQYAKFLKQSAKVPWRKPVSSLNYLLTSVGWRQEHNGFSHQNPSFISGILEKHGKFSSVYFPCDANSLLVTLEDCFKRTDSINVIVSNKNPLTQWLTLKEAREELKKGLGIWEWIDPKGSKNPDVVLAAAGDVLVHESIAAAHLLKKFIPEIKLRFVNVSELTALGVGDERHPLSVSDKDFYHYFTKNRSIIFNFHGYPASIKKLIYGHAASDRFSIHGYREEGTTTTPFNMMVLNQTDRFHLAIEAAQKAAKVNPRLDKKARAFITFCKRELTKHAKYIIEFGKDMEEVEKWNG